MGVEIKQALVAALEHRLFPVMARWLAQAGVSVQEAIDLLRAAAIAEAQKSVPKGISPDSISLVSIRTGLSRRLVRESRARQPREATQPGGGGHRGERVLAGWWHDTEFRDQRGQPRVLAITRGAHSFEALCRRYSGERQYRTILKDLEQVGAVAVLPPGDRVQVLRQSYAAVGWTEAGQTAMAEQLAEHIETCLHNFKHSQGSQHWLCRRVANALVRPEYAGILLRHIRSQVDDQADSCYDALTDPQHTADPLDPKAERISVTFYVNRSAVIVGPPNAALAESPPEGSDRGQVATAAESARTSGTSNRLSRRRGGSKKRK